MNTVIAESLLIITGTMGSGKSVVLGEASDRLTRRGVTHAAIDVDTLGLAYLPSGGGTDSLMYENLRCVCRNYAAAGVSRFLVARAIEHHAALTVFAQSLQLATRWSASQEVMEQRVGARESGIAAEAYVRRVAELSAILDQAKREDFVVVNEGRALTDVALEMLVKAGWVSSGEIPCITNRLGN